MRYLLFLLLLISSVTYSQSNVDFRGDSARFYKNGGSMEVVIRNSTKDRTNGVLVNTGNGVTSFLKYLNIDSISAFRGRFDHQLVLPDDTLSYAPSSIVRTTTRLLAFAPNGSLYKLWNGVWSLVGAGDSSNVQILGDSAIVVNDDTLFVTPVTFETDLAPEYAFQDGDTIRLYPRQYIQDSVLITKSGDTLFFPGGDTLYVGPVILAYSGASGKTSVWSSGDTLYNKRDIEGSSITITDNADSSRTFAVTESNFILNQFLSKEDKTAWFRKSSVDSSLGGLFIAKSSSSSVGYFTQRDQGTPPTRGTTIGTFASGGYNGTTYTTTTRAGMRFFASETHSGSANGTEPMFFATKNGTTSTTARMRLFNEGGVGFNAANSELGVMDSIIRAAIFLQASFGTTSATSAFLLRDSSRNNLFRVDDAGQLFARKYYYNQGNVYPKIDSLDGAIVRGNMGDFDEIATAYKYLDPDFISQTLGMDLSKMTTNTAMGDGIAFYEATFIPGDDTITGVRFYMHTQGSFTGDNTNSIALYKMDGGTLTKVAETANDENIWKAAATTTSSVAFSTPYIARRGLYFVAALYNQSAQTTAPALGCAAQSVNANTFSVIKPYAINTGLTTQADTITHSALTISRIPVYFSLYK